MLIGFWSVRQIVYGLGVSDGLPVIRPIRSEAEARSDDAPSFGFLYMYKREIGYSSVCFFGKVIRISVPFPTSL